MGHVIDVAGDDAEAAMLTETGSGGLFGGQLLHDAPLESHVYDAERTKYVLFNKKEGVHIERDGTERRLPPDDAHRMLVAVTDVRILFVVGRASGDVVRSVPLVDVVDVGVEDGLVTSSLWVGTEDAHYEFPCRGDLTPVAVAIDGRAQATVRAYRLLDEARYCLDAADDHRADDRFDAALDAVATADERVQTARDRLDSVGPGALATFNEDSADARRRVREYPRAIQGAHAHHARHAGRAAWLDGEYEQAHDRYESAIAACRAAAKSPGDDPSEATLAERCERAESERDELQRAPLADAQQVAHGASSIDGPAPAAERWELAIRRYQDVLYLDWGRDERRFDGDTEAVREAIVDAVDNLVTERRAAARACREAAHAHQMGGHPTAARDAYRTALSHLDRAESVVREIAPNRETGLEDTRAAIEDELETVPEESGGPGGSSHGRSGASRPASGQPADDSEWWALVADYWAAHDWTVEREDGDLLATSNAPLELRAYVRLDGRNGDASPEAVEACAEMARFVDADLAVLATEDDPDSAVRERATECDVYLQNLSKLNGDHTTSAGNANSA